MAGAVVVLAGLDIVGSLVAQQYATTHRLTPLLVGAGTFVVLFVVYALSLEVAEMSIVTLGWIVLLQVGLLLLDVRGGLRMQTRQWVAVVLVIGLQCYLVASTTGAVDGPVSHAGAGAGSGTGSAPADRPDPAAAPVVLAGPTCDRAGVLYREAGYELPVALTAGDRVRLPSAGACTASNSSVDVNGLPPLTVHCSAPVPAAV